MSTTYKVTLADFKLIIPLLFMGVLAQFGSDNYLPSFPALSDYFGVPNMMIKWSMTTYLIGMAGLQLIFGPLSDHIGRKPVLGLGFAIFVIGSLACAMSQTITWFLVARFIQGAGLGAGFALYRAILRDCFTGSKMAKVGAIVLMCIGLTPPLAPITGGYIQHYFNWQMNFYLIAFMGAAYVSWMLYFFPETSPKIKAEKNWLISIKDNTLEALRCPAFTVNLTMSGLSYGTLIVYLTMSPYLFQEVMHMTPVGYGWTNVINASGFFLGGVINATCVGRFCVNQMMRVGSLLISIGAFVLVATGLYGWIEPPPVLVAVFIFSMGCSFIFSNASAAALQSFPKTAGLVGAIFGCLQVSIAAIASLLAAFVYVHNQELIGVIILCFGLIMLALKIVYR